MQSYTELRVSAGGPARVYGRETTLNAGPAKLAKTGAIANGGCPHHVAWVDQVQRGE
jgi:hypothetical protein